MSELNPHPGCGGKVIMFVTPPFCEVLCTKCLWDSGKVRVKAEEATDLWNREGRI